MSRRHWVNKEEYKKGQEAFDSTEESRKKSEEIVHHLEDTEENLSFVKELINDCSDTDKTFMQRSIAQQRRRDREREEN